jgi:uncharacterized membrane protein YbhN (UPF0104 family)
MERAPAAADLTFGAAGEPLPESSADHDAHRLRNGLIWTVALVVLLLAIGLAVPKLRGVLDRASEANLWWLALGVALELASCLGYVATVRLVLHRGPRREVRRLAWAEMAFGAVVPVGGAGGLAVGAWALRAWGIAWERIANRSAVIFLLTSAINVAALGLAGAALLIGIGDGQFTLLSGLLPIVVSVTTLAFFALLPRIWSKRSGTGGGRLATALGHASRWVTDTLALAREPDWRLVGAIGYLVFDIAVLWACLRAVGVSASIVPMVLGYIVGYMANLVPIPGGVGVLEGGLLGALLLYHLPAAPTAAAVILYHAIALWVPSIGGTVAFAHLRQTISAGTHLELQDDGRFALVSGEPARDVAA